MKHLKTFDLNDYEVSYQKNQRTAVRAIIIQNGKLAMIQSTAFMECKFPGGGLEQGETHEQCLIREVKEETGLSLLSSTMKPFGSVREKRKDSLNDDHIFEMTSYYYLAQVDGVMDPVDLDDYEEDYGYHLVWLSLDQAIHINEEANALHRTIATWIEREIFVLKYIKQEGLMDVVHS